MKIVRWLFLFSISILSADIEDHFKPVADKLSIHKMPNIDFIYMINLDERPEKYAFCMRQLAPYGIVPYRFSAVNGWKLSLEALNELGVRYEPWMRNGIRGTYYLPDKNGIPSDEIVETTGRTYFCYDMSPGAVGIVLSHLSLLQDAYDSNYETIWIMEDDIEVIRNPLILSELIEKLDTLIGREGWDILFTDQDTKGSDGNYVPCVSFAWRPNYTPLNTTRFEKRQDIGSDFRCIGARYGGYSMIVRRSGIKKILRFLKNNQIFLPYDMEYTLPADIRIYTVKNDIVSTQPKAASDNRTPNYALSSGE